MVSGLTGLEGPDLIALGAAAREARLVRSSDPHNPTGVVHPAAVIRALADTLDPGTLLVVDEAYGEFVSLRWTAQALPSHHGLLAVRSLPQAYGLAGARVACAVEPTSVMAALHRAAMPFRPGAASAAAAEAAVTGDLAALAAAPAAQAVRRDALRDRLRATGFMVPLSGGELRPARRSARHRRSVAQAGPRRNADSTHPRRRHPADHHRPGRCGLGCRPHLRRGRRRRSTRCLNLSQNT